MLVFLKIYCEIKKVENTKRNIDLAKTFLTSVPESSLSLFSRFWILTADGRFSLLWWARQMPFYLLQKFNLESLLLLLDASSSVAFASVNIREGVHASLFKVRMPWW